MNPETMRVRTVTGEVLTVSREHYDRGKTQIPIFTKTGKRLSDHHERMGWRWKPSTLHRGNIAEILP